MTGDLLLKAIELAKPDTYLRIYRGTVVAQDATTGNVTLNPENALLPQLPNLPFLGAIVFQVLPGEKVFFAFDANNAAFVLGPVGNGAGAESVALGTTLQTFMDSFLAAYLSHKHASNGAAPTPDPLLPVVVPNLQSSTAKVRP
jgi:hypothetical protein